MHKFTRKKRNQIEQDLDKTQIPDESESTIPPEERHLSLNTLIGKWRRAKRYSVDTKKHAKNLKCSRVVQDMNSVCPYDGGTDDWFDWMLHDLSTTRAPQVERHNYVSKSGWKDMTLVKEKLQPMFEMAFDGYGLNEICVQMGFLKGKLEEMAMENPFLAKALLMIESVSKAWWERKARAGLNDPTFQTTLWKANMEMQFKVSTGGKVRNQKETKVRDVYNNISVNNNGEGAVSQIDLGALNDAALDSLLDCFESIDAELTCPNEAPSLLGG